MKNKEKEIEEMSREICSEYDCVIPCQSCGYYGYANCRDVKSAEKLYIAGYRKASDVAREIFKEIEKRIAALEYRANTTRKTVKVEELKAQINWVLHDVVPNTIAELKKKYESEEN